MTFEIITETKLAIGPFPTKEDAIEKAADLGLGEARDSHDERAPGWEIGIADS